jgi:hypothetical protein
LTSGGISDYAGGLCKYLIFPMIITLNCYQVWGGIQVTKEAWSG